MQRTDSLVAIGTPNNIPQTSLSSELGDRIATTTYSQKFCGRLVIEDKLQRSMAVAIVYRSAGQIVSSLLWPPCVADADIIFLPYGFYLFFLA